MSGPPTGPGGAPTAEDRGQPGTGSPGSPDPVIDPGRGRPRRPANLAEPPGRAGPPLRRRAGPLEEVKTVRGAFGGTVNDVVLAGVTGGLGRLLDARGELEPGLTLKVFCPVSVRDDHEHFALGNRVSAMFVPLPVAEPDPAPPPRLDPRGSTGT